MRKNMIRATIAVLATCLLTMSTSASPQTLTRSELPLPSQLSLMDESHAADLDSAGLDSFIVAFMTFQNVPGLSTAIVKNGQVIWTAAYGYSYLHPLLPVTDSTLFMLASISKTVTGTALMQLYEQGSFDLDDPVSDYLPFAVTHPSYPAVDITFAMILSHTSGIRDNWFVMPYYPGQSPVPLGEYLENYLTPGGSIYYPNLNFYDWAPGTGFGYCNIAVALAGYLAEVISGEPFDQYCQENIFAPLSMNETAWFLSQLDSMHVAMPYSWNGNTHVPYGHYGYSDYPSGQLRTSAPQLLRFLTAFMQYGQLDTVRILDSATVALMTTPYFPQVDPTQGLIWYNFNLGGRLLWGHSGGDLGVSTDMYYCPNQNTGIVALSNGETYLYSIVDALFDYAEWYEVSLTVTLTPHDPPIQVPPEGGSFLFDLAIENADTTGINFDVWINAVLPDSSVYGPIILRRNLFLPPGGSLVRDSLMQFVPASAPFGEYSYIASAGEYPGTVVDSSSFTFTKLAGSPQGGSQQDWELQGWDSEPSALKTYPSEVVLISAYPNPFNATTELTYTLPSPGKISLVVYDIMGREMARLADRWEEAGTHRTTFDGENFSSGVYLARLRSGESEQTVKLLLLK